MSFEMFRKTRVKSEELCGNKIIKGGQMGCGSASKRRVKRQKSQEREQQTVYVLGNKAPRFFLRKLFMNLNIYYTEFYQTARGLNYAHRK